MNAKEIVKKIKFHLDYYMKCLKKADCETLIDHYYAKVQDTLEIMEFTEIISNEEYEKQREETLTISSNLKEKIWYARHSWLTIEKNEKNQDKNTGRDN